MSQGALASYLRFVLELAARRSSVRQLSHSRKDVAHIHASYYISAAICQLTHDPLLLLYDYSHNIILHSNPYGTASQSCERSNRHMTCFTDMLNSFVMTAPGIVRVQTLS